MQIHYFTNNLLEIHEKNDHETDISRPASGLSLSDRIMNLKTGDN
jgi:hypothetical protein